MNKEEIINDLRDILTSEGKHDSNEYKEISSYDEDDIEVVVKKLAEYMMKTTKNSLSQ